VNTINKLKVVSIVDEFSYECLKYECNLIQLDGEKWKYQLINENPDLLFVESAWLGKGGKWVRRITGEKENNIMEDLINTCNEMNIPTVFWNKEDPIFFENFIETAKFFDYVFTTDEGCIGTYKRILGHSNVYVLPFAAQPKLHNPIDRGKKPLGKVAFAGTWHKMYSEREKNMEMLLEPACKYGLHIYDRMYYSKFKYRYGFPDLYKSYIKKPVHYLKIPSIYKNYNTFLNVNFTKNSATMFSRRVFELLACGTNVISSYSLGIEKMFLNIVKLCRSKEDVKKHLKFLLYDKELRDRLSVRGQREVFKKHTYRHRMETILEKIGLNYKRREIPGVSIITCINRPNKIENVFSNFERQNYKKKELILILKDDSINIEEWKKREKSYDYVKVFIMDEEKSLGECVNFAMDQARYPYVSNFHEDDYYAPEFLGDLMNPFEYTDAHIVGKQTYYSYMEESETLGVEFPNFENQYVNSLCESAFIMKKEIWNQIKFNHINIKTFKMFFQDCINNGKKLYSADRFNYVYMKPQTTSECKIVRYMGNYIKHIIV
jgi:spore maturation protein CgeB